jgi:hypothetical protein
MYSDTDQGAEGAGSRILMCTATVAAEPEHTLGSESQPALFLYTFGEFFAQKDLSRTFILPFLALPPLCYASLIPEREFKMWDNLKQIIPHP